MPPEWIKEAYAVHNQPFVVDIGCSKGNWVLEYAAAHPHVNVLGIDIRDQVIQMAVARKQKERLQNTHFVCTNANVDACRILDDINAVSRVQLITIQFPDPHFKSSHHKRRVVNQKFVENITSKLSVGAGIFIQSDVDEVMLDMVNLFYSSEKVAPAPGYDRKALLQNPKPFSINTARENACIANDNYNIFRMMFVRE